MTPKFRKPYDTMLQRIVHKYGLYCGLRYCKNLGISFEETYYMMFGKLPKEPRHGL